MPDATFPVNLLLPDPQGSNEGRTLATLLDALTGLGLPEPEYRQLRSAVLSVARLLNARPETLEVKERDLIARLHKLHPREVGVSRKRLQNLRSEFIRALTAVGWQEGRNKSVFTPPWRTLYERLPTKFDRSALTRFFRFCSEQAWLPTDVTDVQVGQFRRYLDEVDFCRSPSTMHRDVLRTWNKMVGTIESWPATTLTLAKTERHWSLPWEAFPPSLRTDVEAWLASLSCDDPLAEVAPSKPQAPATVTYKGCRPRRCENIR